MPVDPSHPDARPYLDGIPGPRRGLPLSHRPDIPDEESTSGSENDWPEAPGPGLADEAAEYGVSHLVNNVALSRPCWPGADGELVSPAEVIQFPERHPELWAHIVEADTSVPVVLSANGVVIGGLLTLCRAFVEGQRSVGVRIAAVVAEVV
jgi:hypothetical protein